MAASAALSYPPGVTRLRSIAHGWHRHGALRFGALAAVGVLLAHDAIYAAGAALGASDAQFAVDGHRYWATFAILVMLVAGVSAGAGLAVLARLSRSLRGMPVVAGAQPGPGCRAELLRLWPRLFLAVTLAYALQENAEHLAAGEAMPGLWVLSAPAYPMAIPALVAVTGLLAAVGAWFRHRTAVLTRKLRAARLALALRHARREASSPRWRDVGWLSARRLLLARPDAERAPPVPSVA